MLGLELLLVQWVFVRRHVLASTIGNGFSFVAVVEVIGVLLMVASVTLLTVAIAVIRHYLWVPLQVCPQHHSFNTAITVNAQHGAA